MVNYSLPLYQHKQEIWSIHKCEKAVNYTATDEMGTRYPFKGYLGRMFGKIRYNGGCIREKDWWQGEYFPLPKLPPGYEIYYRINWGWCIRKV